MMTETPDGIPGSGPLLWGLSAPTAEMLRTQAGILCADLAERSDWRPEDVGWSLAKAAPVSGRRAALVAGDRAGFLGLLAALSAGRSAAGLTEGTPSGDGVAFVFPGQGSQWPGMAVGLLRSSPVFAARITECADALQPFISWSLLDVLQQVPGAPSLDRTDVVQPALFAMMVSLAAVWQSAGVEPVAVLGHSLGEVAAAVVAGALSLDDGARVAALWSQAQQALAGVGGMVAVSAPADVVRARLARWDGCLVVAAVNGPSSVIVSGDLDAARELLSECTAEGVRATMISVDLAAHSPHIDRIALQLAEQLAPVRPRTGRIRFYSAMTGTALDADVTLDAGYWCQTLRSAIQFEQVIRTALADGIGVLLEISPHPVLTAAIQETIESAGAQAVVRGSARRNDGDLSRVLRTLGQLYVDGVNPGWAQMYAGFDARLVPVPGGATGSGDGNGEAVRTAGAPPESSLRARLSELSEAAQRALLTEVVCRESGALLRLATPGEMDPDKPFREQGFDSVTALEIRNRLSAVTGTSLPVTLVFDCPTPADVAEFVRTSVCGGPAAVGSVVERGAADVTDPVVIVGIGCRFPGGVGGPDDLWRVVSEGVDALSRFPANRGWDVEDHYVPALTARGQFYQREAGFLHDADLFDAGFFGISPREATAMDPQQRLLLETAWEAFEHAGIPPAPLRGSRTGVFVGGMTMDYGPRIDHGSASEGYLFTGNTGSVMAGRVSYQFGFEGPAVTVDTACSSSLAALHLAAQAVSLGECGLALVGGVTVMSGLGMFMEFSRQGALAPDGRCKAFSDSADGFGLSEGVGVLLVERLSDARENGHKVLAVVKGSAVNSDGASNGLTAPNGPSQERVIRQALANAGLSASDVDVIEAHGTGTRLGDPVEAVAVLATYGQARQADQPVWLGSVKSNIGHAQAAAGVAGVIKMVLALQHGVVPRTLHVTTPSSHVDWETGAVRVLTEQIPWPAVDRPRRAAVSSFGVSGTNAHVILEQAPAGEPVPAGAGTGHLDHGDGMREVMPWLVSARSKAGLRAQARRLSSYVRDRADLRIEDVGLSLAITRSGLGHRAVVLGRDREELLSGLAAVAGGHSLAEVPVGTAKRVTSPVLVFPGQGTQWAGMAKGLFGSSAVFTEQMTRCADALAPYCDWSLIDVVRSTDEPSPLEHADVIQPVQWAVMVSLAVLWQSVGVHPSAVVGQSEGEIAAAYVAGALSLDDAARVVALRGRASRAVEGAGGMAAADEQIRDLILGGLSGLTPRTSAIAFYSSVTAEVLDTSQLDAAYWFRNLREPTRFERVLRLLAEHGHSAYIEASTHPVLTSSIADVLADAGRRRAVVIGTLRRDHGGPRQFLSSAAEAWVRGVDIDWARLSNGSARTVDLPTYSFHHQRYWLSPQEAPGKPAVLDGQSPSAHPLLRAALPLAGTNVLVFTGTLSLRDQPWLADHTLTHTVVLPGTAFAEFALHAARYLGDTEVAELTLHIPLTFSEHSAVDIQVAVHAGDRSGRRRLTIHSCEAPSTDGSRWTLHADGSLAPETTAPATPRAEPWPPAGATPQDLTGRYADLAVHGYQYGPAFRGLDALWRDKDTRYVEAALPDQVHSAGGSFTLHPALLDAVLQAIVPTHRDGEVLVLFAWRGIRVHAAGATAVRARILETGPDTVSVRITDSADLPVADIDELTVRYVPTDRLMAFHRHRRKHTKLLRVAWSPLGSGSDDPTLTCAILADPAAPGLPAADTLTKMSVTAHSPDPRLHCRDYPGFVALRDALRSGAPAPDVIVAYVNRSRDTEAAAGAHRAPRRLLTFVQQWLDASEFAACRLAVVTRKAVATGLDDQVEDLAAASVWGLLRSAQTENPGRIVLLDLDGRAASFEALASALGSREPQIALRNGKTLVPRMVRVAEPELAAPAGPWRLESTRRGDLDHLRLAAWPETGRPLAEQEVRVGLRAAGINFKDVLVTLGVVDDDRHLCGEGAGVVLDIGSGVQHLSVGDRVMGLFPAGVGPASITDHRLLVPVPAGWTFSQAATTPIAFLTAYYGLVDLARVRPGERLLVHAATGGVGMAAIQIARHLGTDILATASTPKWDTLRALGLGDAQIASSRTLEFEQRFHDTPPDVILNSLAGEFTNASLRVLRARGRFLELGKTDIRSPDRIAEEYRGVSYHAFDLTDAGADRLQQILRHLHQLFEGRLLQPLPLTAFDIRHARQAFHLVRAARHTGKVVLTIPVPLNPDGTILITGGTGTLGALTARHLITRHGARNLILASRSGLTGVHAHDLQTQLRALGATITVTTCDVSDADAVAALISGIPADHPLTAIVHTAGVVRDATFPTLTADHFNAVLRPKSDAAWHLHQHSTALDLSAFVLFSSIAGTLGTPGQANYAAANAALDALACQRGIAGLPATSIAWGYWKQPSGLTSHLKHADQDRLRRYGISPLSTDDALALLDQALITPLPTVVAAALDPSDISRDHGAIPPILTSLASASPRHSVKAAIPNPATVLTTLNPAQQRRDLRDLIRTHLAAVLTLSDAGDIEPSTPFRDLGFDSLTIVELRNRINTATGFHLTEATFFDHPTLDELTRHLHTLLPPAAGDTSDDHLGITPLPPDNTDYESISDEQLFTRLDARLGINHRDDENSQTAP
jgi:acyl transferase domain-containing protein/NADPH:quinone reductase-like Zn-dependent oxidoreductase/acyl carrier protein